MILYAILFYVLLLAFSVVFFLVKKPLAGKARIARAIPQKRSGGFFFSGKVKISRFITQYECPECGYKSMVFSAHCPHCLRENKELPLVANTMLFQG